jgi:ADP-ribose pyrophosphatase
MTAKPNTVLSTRTVYSGGLISVREEEVRQDDGRTTKREIVEHKPAAVIIPYFEGSDEILFIEQYRDSVTESLLELPAGMVGDDSSLDDTARRELLEETGYEAKQVRRLCTYFTSPGFTNEQHHLYLATQLIEVSGIQDINEVSNTLRLHRSEAMRFVREGRILDGKTILGLLWSELYLPHGGRRLFASRRGRSR